MDLDALAIFHLVAAHGGFGRTTRATGRPKATLSRRVADLERELGIRLFERGRGALRLTEEGRALLASTQGPLDELNATGDALRGRVAEPRGRLRVSVPLLLGSAVMGELAARFLARYRQVHLEVVAEDRYVDLIQEGFDVAIRANPHPDDDLVGRCFVRDRLLVVASARLARPPPQVDGRPVAVPAVIRATGNDAEPWVVENEGTRRVLQPTPVLRLSTLAIRHAVLVGAGAALLPNLFVRDDIAAGRLVSWGMIVERPLEHWILHASTRQASSKVRAFVDFVTATFKDDSLSMAFPCVQASRSNPGVA